MRAGRLDRRAILKKRVITRNDFGEDIVTYEAQSCPLWVDSQPVSGNERWIVQQFMAEVTTIFMTHWRTDISPVDIILHDDGREYDILAVLEVGKRNGLAINARARAEKPGV